MRQIADGGFSQNVRHGGLDLGPHGMSWTPGLALAAVPRSQAEIEPNGTLHGLHHFQNRRAVAAFGKLESPGVPAMRSYQTGPSQVLEHFGKKLLGALGGRGQFRAVGAASRWQTCQMDHDTYAVVGCSCELHVGWDSIPVATFKNPPLLDNDDTNECIRGFCRTQIGEFAPFALH